MKILMLACLLLAQRFAFGAPNAAKVNCQAFARAAGNGSGDQRLATFLSVQWKYLMKESPEWATFVGYPGQNDRLSDQSLAAVERHRVETKCQREALGKIKRQDLSLKNRINFDLAVRDLDMMIEGDAFGAEFMPINHMSGFQIDFIDLLTAMPTGSAGDFKNMISRLDKIPLIVDQLIELMREGLKRKLTPTKQFLPKVIEEINALLTPKVQDSPLYRPFAEMPGQNAKDQSQLREAARQSVEQRVYPAFAKLRAFMEKDYIPQARETMSWSDLPNGASWYSYLVKLHTTTTATPDQLHQIGLNEVERIHSQMVKIKDEVRFKGDLKAFNTFLMTDKQFYFTKAEDLLTAYRDITKRVDPELTKLFKRLPRLTYGVRPVPEFRAASTSGAEYQSGSLEAGRAGFFQANTYDLKSRPKWQMETLAFHEGVPGHHFQISIAQEIDGNPEFRKYGSNTAYTEGWALYAESLGEEMGFYKDPYSKYGHYSEEMLRAVRLVVDTGLHAKGWSRQKALDYFRSQMPISDVESEIEINRYITWPGQALAYKVGQMKFRELRDRASQKLGPKFDVRSFHDVVLGQGSLPMDELEKVIDEWVVEQRKHLRESVPI